MQPGSERLHSYLPCMLWTAVLIRWSLQDGALLTAAVWGVLVGLHQPARALRQTPQPVGTRQWTWRYRHCLLLRMLAACCHLDELSLLAH